MSVSLVLILALVADRVFGEPQRFHPLRGFGFLANRLEQKMNPMESSSKIALRFSGLLSVLVIVLPFVWLGYCASMAGWVVDVLLLMSCIGWQSLREHGYAVIDAILEKNVDLARERVGMMVSRDTGSLDQSQISKATLESVLENGSDAIFAAIFWFAIAGVPGVIAYRLVNTLDAMWGYKTKRFLHFGWAAAKLDDVMNYIPARLTAFSYFVASQKVDALRCWITQGANWKSPNAGPVMAAGAGALGVQLGGEAIYHGQQESRPVLGTGREPEPQDIRAAFRMIFYAIVLWVSGVFAIEMMFR